MHALTLLVATLGLAHAQVASVDRYAGGGCTSTICNKAGSGDLHAGCNAITDSCQSSLRLNYANAGCKVTIWADAQCKNTKQSANITTAGGCYALGPPIKGISVTC